MKNKYYVCGLNGIISGHRTCKNAILAYGRRLKSIRRKNMEPTIALGKKENGKNYIMVDGEWSEVDSLIVNY